MKKLTSLAAALLMTAPVALADPPEPVENAAERTEQISENAADRAEEAAERADEVADESENDLVEDRAERQEDRMERRSDRVDEAGDERANQIENVGNELEDAGDEIEDAADDAFDAEGWDDNRRGLGVYVGADSNRVMIDEVQANSPAYQAGLRAGDEIISINGQPVNGRDRFITDVGRFSDDGPMQFRYRRGGQTYDARATLRPYNTIWGSQTRQAARPNYDAQDRVRDAERVNDQRRIDTPRNDNRGLEAPNDRTFGDESGRGVPDRIDESPNDLENAAEELTED